MQDEYLNRIMEDRRTLTTTQIARDYGLSARKLNQLLEQGNIQRKRGKQWELCTQHEMKGLITISEFPFMHKQGQPDVGVTMKWTQTGRVLIHDYLLAQGYTPKGLVG